MFRSVLILFTAFLSLSPAYASLESKDHLSGNKPIPIPRSASLPIANASYRITPSTEVLLDGRPCRYEQIPNSAIITLLETTSNYSNEIVRIHFRTARRSVSPTISK